MQAWECSTPCHGVWNTAASWVGPGAAAGGKESRVAAPLGACRRVAGRSSCEPPRSDPKSHSNDRLSDRAQAGVVAAGVAAHELVGMIDRDRFPLGGNPFGLLDNDP